MKRYAYACLPVCIALLFFACGKKGDPGLPVPRAPEAPKRFQAVARAEAIILLWKAPDTNANGSPLLDLAGFKIARSEMPIEKACLKCPREYREIFDYVYQGPRGQEPEKRLFYYQDTAVAFKNLYTYRMQCYNEKEHPGLPTKPVDVYWDVPPAAPLDLSVQRSNRLLRFTWNPPAALADGTPLDKIEGYTVYRTVTRGVYEQAPLHEAPVSEPVFEDTPEKLGVTYFYTVRALRRVQETLIESLPSNEIEVAYVDIQPPGIPEGLTAIPQKDGMLLKWIPKAEQDFAGFNIYRREARAGGFVRLNREPVPANSWLDTTAGLRTRYVYAVTSVDRSPQANESRMSETVEVLYIIK
jgi:hypothetical protein